ncbi:MAG: aldolase/citrate lyase family protein [Variovorax sp.]
MTVKRILQAQPSRYQIGTFIKTASAHIVEILGTTSLDFAVIDAEHAPLDRAMLDLMVMAGRAAGLPLLVRIPDRAAHTILSVLDMGAGGLLVPHVDTVDDARAVVSHARFCGGDRGFSGSPRFAGYGNLGMKDALRIGDEALVVCQIESPLAVQNAKQIAALPGVAGLFVGRADLALAMGLDDSKHPDVTVATERTIETALQAGKLAGVFTSNVAERDQFAAKGANWFVCGSDQALLRQGASTLAHPEA